MKKLLLLSLVLSVSASVQAAASPVIAVKNINTELPGEVLADKVLFYLPISDLASCSSVCKDWKDLALRPIVTEVKKENPAFKVIFDRAQNRALNYAIERKDFFAIEYLKIRGVKDPLYGSLPIVAASQYGDAKYVQSLIASSVEDVSGRGHRLDIPLICAAHCGHLDVVRVLCDARADINMKDSCVNPFAKTALDHAAQEGHAEVVQYLIAQHREQAGSDKQALCGLFHFFKDARRKSIDKGVSKENKGNKELMVAMKEIRSVVKAMDVSRL